jgi:phage-related minor tail protein
MSQGKEAEMSDEQDRSIREEIEIGGHELVEKVKHLIREGNVRQLRIIAEDGETKLEMPLTVGVIAGGALALAAPLLAVLGVIAALVKKVKIEVERAEETPALTEPKVEAKADA